MRVLHLLGTGKPGGVETFVLQLVTNIPREDAEFTVAIAGEDGPVSETLRKAGAVVMILKSSSIAQAVDLLAAARWDIVHANAGGRITRHAARGFGGAKVISHLHGIPEEWVPHLDDNAWVQSQMDTLSSGADEIAVSSEWMKRLVGRPDVVKLSYGVDVERFSPLVRSGKRAGMRAMLGIHDDAKVVGFIGRLVRQKGISHLATLAGSLPDGVQVVVVGDGPERSYLAGIERVTLLGSGTDAAEAMSAFDVTVMPSAWEPFGIVAIESLAMGIPVAAFDVGGLSEAIAHGEDGLLVPPGDVDALRSATLQLLDETRASELGARGRQRIERTFDVRQTSAAVLAHYRELIGTKSRSS